MSLAPDLAFIFRAEVRQALGIEVSQASVLHDLSVLLERLPQQDARVLAARLSDAAMTYLVATDPVLGAPPPTPSSDEPGPAVPAPEEPSPAAPVAAAESEPEPESAAADAVASAA